MKDFLGNEIIIGDKVIVNHYDRTSSHFRKGIIIEFKQIGSNYCAIIEYEDSKFSRGYTSNKIIKYNW